MPQKSYYCRIKATTSFPDGAAIEWNGQVESVDSEERQVALSRSRDVVEVRRLWKKHLRAATARGLEIVDSDDAFYVVLSRDARLFFAELEAETEEPDDSDSSPEESQPE